ncbi:MAG: insulinase family protein [Bacteroidia bacterium]|nr:insulinase family protein [Bacteroidia bacterium]
MRKIILIWLLVLMEHSQLFGQQQMPFKYNKNLIKSGAMLIGKVVSEYSIFNISVKEYSLSNGLKVLIHEDHSDPIVYVDVTYHVGSNREQQGRSGFAHFFEHMMFQGSKHVADDQHFKIVTEAGGIMNGTTNTDRTNYFQVVPVNQLEKILWLEADRMGFLLDSVTQQKFEIQRETVKNERGQRYDNAPYGLVFEKIGEALYPQGHPYSWSTIGYIEDLNRVDVNDLRRFYLRWYGPNNAVITIAGDVDPDKTFELVKKYFGSIPRGPEVKNLPPMPSSLKEKRYISYEDNIKLPQLNMAFPAVQSFQKESYALDALCHILSDGEKSPMYRHFIKTKKAMSASIFNYKRELDGYLHLTIRAIPDSKLSDIEKDFYQCLEEWEKSGGATEQDLVEYKLKYRSDMIDRLSTIMGKGQIIAYFQTHAGNHKFIIQEAMMVNSLTPKDVMDVYYKYLKNKPAVILSVVPKGKNNLIAAPDNWKMPARIIEKESDEYKNLSYRPPKDNFDRSKMPQAGPPKPVSVPVSQQTYLSKNIKLVGISFNELPKIEFNIIFPYGYRFENPEKAGSLNLLASMLNKSTAKNSVDEIEKKLGELGSNITVYSTEDNLNFHVSCFSDKIDPTIEILKEIMFEPGFKPDEFEEEKANILQKITNNLNNASYLANILTNKLKYKENTRMYLPNIGTTSTINNITLEDLKKLYNEVVCQNNVKVIYCGNINFDDFKQKVSFLTNLKNALTWPTYNKSEVLFVKPKIYFFDKKNAAQSEIRMVYSGMPFDATGEYFKTNAAFYAVGVAFNSRLNYYMREKKGWTYGSRGGFSGDKYEGYFQYGGGFKWNATDSVIRDFNTILSDVLKNGLTDDEWNFTRSALIQSEALKYESIGQKLAFITRVVEYNLSERYMVEQAKILQTMKKEEANELLRKHLKPENIQYLVVGDGNKVLDGIKKLGFDVEIISDKDIILN